MISVIWHHVSRKYHVLPVCLSRSYKWHHSSHHMTDLLLFIIIWCLPVVNVVEIHFPTFSYLCVSLWVSGEIFWRFKKHLTISSWSLFCLCCDQISKQSKYTNYSEMYFTLVKYKLMLLFTGFMYFSAVNMRVCFRKPWKTKTWMCTWKIVATR